MTLRERLLLSLLPAIFAAVPAGAGPPPNSGQETRPETSPTRDAAVAGRPRSTSTRSPPPEGPRWHRVDVPNLGAVHIAVARPQGRGPFPTVVVLHGSHGFAAEYLELAEDLAAEGVLAAAVCWFSGGVGEGRRFMTPVGCPEGTPTMPPADSDQAFATIRAVVGAVRTLPGSRGDWIALFGHSRGGGAIRNYLLRGGIVQAGIMNSAGYPASSDVSQLNTPILMLHGTADRPADGGSAFTSIRAVRVFEAKLRGARKPVEVHYYHGGTHNGLFALPEQRRDTIRRTVKFIRARLTAPVPKRAAGARPHTG